MDCDMKRLSVRSDHGAMLLNLAVGLMVFIGMLAFVVDYGVMWVGRGQAQNAADAGALAGAVAMALDTNGWTDRTETGPARAAALRMAQSNAIWSVTPSVNVATDVFFTGDPADMCPADVNGRTPCIRVDVYRNQARGNPLPAIFGRAVGLVNQGVRATATARVAVANASDCLKPWAIPDKWLERYPVPAPWTSTSTYETGAQQGQTWTPYNPPDLYTRPSGSDPGPGLPVPAVLGRQARLKAGGPQTSIAPGVYFPVRIPTYTGTSTGGSDYRANISGCNGIPISPGTPLQSENGNMVGPPSQGVADLIALDPMADWDPATKSVINSCAQASTSCAPRSPRIVAIPIFDTAVFESTKRQGLPVFTVVNILGFFIDDMVGNDVVGYLCEVPGLTTGSAPALDPRAAFFGDT